MVDHTNNSLNHLLTHSYGYNDVFTKNQCIFLMQINRIYQSQEHQTSANTATDLQNFIKSNSCSTAITGKWPTETQSYAKPSNGDGFLRC